MRLKLLLRNAFRHKLRTTLTIAGIAVAVLAFGLLRTIVDAWYAGVNASSAGRLVTRNAISLIFTMPISYKDKIRGVKGVKQVSYGRWYGGVYIDEKNFFPNFAVEPETYLALYPEFIVPEDQKKAFIMDRKGCLAGRKLVRRFGWKVGDTITLKGMIFPGSMDFTLRGAYEGKDNTIDETQFFFHWAYLNESLRKSMPRRADQSGFFMIGLDDPSLAAEVSQAVDGIFRNSPAETLTETEKAFQLSFISMTEAIVIVIRLVSLVVIFIIMAVMANTMAMTVRERMAEYAVLKTLGFGGIHIAGLIFGESMAISLIGGGIGIALTFPAARAFASALDTFFPIFNVTETTLYLDVAAALLVAVVAASLPAWRAINVRISEGLRTIG